MLSVRNSWFGSTEAKQQDFLGHETDEERSAATSFLCVTHESGRPAVRPLVFPRFSMFFPSQHHSDLCNVQFINIHQLSTGDSRIRMSWSKKMIQIELIHQELIEDIQDAEQEDAQPIEESGDVLGPLMGIHHDPSSKLGDIKMVTFKFILQEQYTFESVVSLCCAGVGSPRSSFKKSGFLPFECPFLTPFHFASLSLPSQFFNPTCAIFDADFLHVRM